MAAFWDEDWPAPRAVGLPAEVAAEVASAFTLGDLNRPAQLAARGWVSFNVLWRLETESGRWAVKEIAPEVVHLAAATAAIEIAAHQGGVACPATRLANTGRVVAPISGRFFRCHEWIDGEVPTRSLTAPDAVDAGRQLGRLHRLKLPYDANVPAPPHFYGEAHWRDLARQAEALDLTWSSTLESALPRILLAEEAARGWVPAPGTLIAGHNDVRPDNVLRTDTGIVLVDWDGAGPAIAGLEVAKALPWWHPHEDAFCAGYEESGGVVDLETCTGEDGGLLWWVEFNARMSIARPTWAEATWAVGSLLANYL